jgi:hypothetical protein
VLHCLRERGQDWHPHKTSGKISGFIYSVIYRLQAETA